MARGLYLARHLFTLSFNRLSLFQITLQSGTETKQLWTKRIKHDWEWNPFFVKAALFSQMRARRVILTETRQWKRATEVNPITMDSKTGECYSTPQKLLPHPNEVYLPIEKPCLHYKAGKRSMQFKFGYCHIQSQKGLEVRIHFFAISFELDVDVCADSAAVSSWEPMYHLLLIVYLTVCYHYD